MLKQLSVYAENKKGNLQRITGTLADRGINIWGSVTNDSAEYGIIRMIVEKPEEAQQILQEAGYLAKLSDVIGVEMADEVGALNKLLIALTESNINVDYIYLSFNRESGQPVQILHTQDTPEVASCLNAKGFRLL
ncbi:MAG: amino acid-binding protein [Lachnospiraceae bacterium]|nr:amino acid-binding protein [Lachnospiraceae bacterium]